MNYEEKFFSLENILISLKAIVVSVVTSLILIIPGFLVRLLLLNGNIAVSVLISLISIPAYLLTWGWLAQKFWGWY